MFIIKKISNSFLLLLILILIFLKIFYFLLNQSGLSSIQVGGGGDADYYDFFAKGGTDVATSIWPIILNYLNNYGLYSREYITFFLFILTLIFIPLLINKLSNLKFYNDQKLFLILFFIISLYPTLLFYSLDIFRDPFMVWIFLIVCWAVKLYTTSNNILIKIFYFLCFISFSIFLYKLRGYLGFSLWAAFLLMPLKFNKKRVVIFLFAYLLILFIFNYLGFFNELTEYREGFEEANGGSTLGLDFSNSFLFIPNYILSFLGQLIGLYITNPIALILFLVETIPFLICFLYVIKNISYTNLFLRFLLIFFIIYSSIWLIGNDNLGTAVRLRLFNYIAIYICFFSILKIKKDNPRGEK